MNMQQRSARRSLRRVPTVDAVAATMRMERMKRDTLSKDDFINGRLLDTLAKTHMSNFRELAPQRAFAPEGVVTCWGSLCSGSEGCASFSARWNPHTMLRG